MRNSLRQRFEQKFTKGSDSECWIWNAARSDNGYGKIRVSIVDEFGMLKHFGCYAHRVSYELYVAKIEDGKHVLHTCDNPPCVNPSHLFIGTNTDNILDRMNKGRSTLGSRNKMSKLTEDSVRRIRAMYAAGGMTYQLLADEFGVGAAAILKIIRRQRWKHIP